jgi:transcriptional regulator with XRE-family HTH domain
MDAKAIGKRLAALRGGRSREEVAKAVGVSPSAVAMYESGNRIPRDEVKIALASYFGVGIEALFYGTDVHRE